MYFSQNLRMNQLFPVTLYKREGIKICILIITSIAPFVFSLNSDFVFDDSEAISKNKDVNANSFLNPFYNDFWGVNIRSNTSHKSYRPLTINTFRFNYILSGHKLIPYHFKVTNLICHMLCCILVYYTYRAMSIGVLCKRRKNYFKDVDFYGAVLFCVHPLHTEAVSGIVGRADILAAITYFASFLCYHNSMIYCNRNSTWLYLLASTKLGFISMLFKENGVTVLAFNILYEMLINWEIAQFIMKKIRCKNNANLDGIHCKFIIRIIISAITIFLSLSARWLIMGYSVPQFKSIDNPAAFTDNISSRVATYNYLYFLNFLIHIWPQWLCFDWSMGCVPVIENPYDPRLLFVFIFYLYIISLIRHIYKKKTNTVMKRLLILAASTLVIPFLPASNIFLTVGFVLAERILYIPSAGYCLLVVIGFKCIEKIYKKIAISLYIYLIIIYSLRSAQRSFEWQNEYELFTSGLKVCPLNAKIHYNVAKVADTKNLTEWSLCEYREAIRLYPDYYQAMNNLANLLRTRKELPEAELYLKRALSLKNDFPAAWMNLGIVYAAMGRHTESEMAYLSAIQHRHIYPDCFYNLGNLYLDMNETDKAIIAWNKAIDYNPKHILAWTNYLALLDNKGLTKEALEKLPLALNILNDAASIHFVAANLYGKVEKYKMAEEHFTKCITLFGNRVQAIHHANFGVLYHRWKKYKLAEIQYKKALKIDSRFSNALKNLRSLEKLL